MEQDCSSFGPKSDFDVIVYMNFSDFNKFKIY